MKVLVQRCKNAKVIVENEIVGEIEKGLMLLVGITHADTLEDVLYCAKKVAGLRIFDDADGKMNLSLNDMGGSILSISQFTLYGSTEKGNRPSYTKAAKPEIARSLYEKFNEILATKYSFTVETGVFGAMMEIDFINDGPVTLMIES